MQARGQRSPRACIYCACACNFTADNYDWTVQSNKLTVSDSTKLKSSTVKAVFKIQQSLLSELSNLLTASLTLSLCDHDCTHTSHCTCTCTIIGPSNTLINPRRACAARVTVLVLSFCPSVRPSVCPAPL